MFELDRLRGRKLAPASIALGALTLIFFAIELARYGTSPSAGELLELGASERARIWNEHQLWRLLCPAFLHAGIVHIAMNGYTFVLLAPFVERIWGSARFLVIYVVSAIAGCALSSRASDAISVGASGALFGLMGFLVAAAYAGTHRHEVRTIVQKTWGQGLLVSVGAMFFYGLSPGTHIDNMAHLGGLLAGAGLGLLLVETEESDHATLALGGAAVLAIAAAWGGCFLDAREQRRFEETCQRANAAHERGDFLDCANACEEALVIRPHDERAWWLCYLEGSSYLKAGRPKDAGYAFERAYRTCPDAHLGSLRRGLASEAALSSDTELKAAIAAILSRD